MYYPAEGPLSLILLFPFVQAPFWKGEQATIGYQGSDPQWILRLHCIYLHTAGWISIGVTIYTALTYQGHHSWISPLYMMRPSS